MKCGRLLCFDARNVRHQRSGSERPCRNATKAAGHLTTQKTLYVEISRARDRAELVTDDRDALRERLEAVTGERNSALEAVEPAQSKPVEPALEPTHDQGWEEIGPEAWEQSHEPEKVHEPQGIEMEM